MSLVLPYVLNGLGTLFGFPYMSARRVALAQYGNELQRTLTRAAEDEMPISVTLGSRKTYVGLVGLLAGSADCEGDDAVLFRSVSLPVVRAS